LAGSVLPDVQEEPFSVTDVDGWNGPGRRTRPLAAEGEGIMLYWALVFLVLALIAGVFGFGGIASTAAGIAKILFLVFLVLFVVGLLFNAFGRRAP
jgi:uncharacterized membrane protein YtjA (UPF0391 family)